MSEWSGRKDRGTRTYTDKERDRVVAAMKQHVGQVRAVLLEDLRIMVGLPSRTLRAVLSDLDGVEWVLAYTETGAVYAAEWQEEAAEYNGHLWAQVQTMQGRLARRRGLMEARLPRRQGMLL